MEAGIDIIGGDPKHWSAPYLEQCATDHCAFQQDGYFNQACYNLLGIGEKEDQDELCCGISEETPNRYPDHTRRTLEAIREISTGVKSKIYQRAMSVAWFENVDLQERDSAEVSLVNALEDSVD